MSKRQIRRLDTGNSIDAPDSRYWRLSTYVYCCVLLKHGLPMEKSTPKEVVFSFCSLFYPVFISCTCHTEQRKKRWSLTLCPCAFQRERERERRVRTSKGRESETDRHAWLSPIYHVIAKSLISPIHPGHPRPSLVRNPSSSCAQEDE